MTILIDIDKIQSHYVCCFLLLLLFRSCGFNFCFHLLLYDDIIYRFYWNWVWWTESLNLFCLVFLLSAVFFEIPMKIGISKTLKHSYTYFAVIPWKTPSSNESAHVWTSRSHCYFILLTKIIFLFNKYYDDYYLFLGSINVNVCETVRNSTFYVNALGKPVVLCSIGSAL